MGGNIHHKHSGISLNVIMAATVILFLNSAFVIGSILFLWPGFEDKSWRVGAWILFMTSVYPFIGWLSFSAAVGHTIQSENQKDTAARNEYVDDIIMTNLKSPTMSGADCGLVMASIVVAASHWQSFRSNYRRIIGGEVPILRKPLEWGRKEVIVRLKEQAKQSGWTQLHNVRIETSIIGNVAQGKGLKTELHAYATGARNT